MAVVKNLEVIEAGPGPGETGAERESWFLVDI